MSDLLLGPIWAPLELYDQHLDLTFILPDSVLLTIAFANQFCINNILVGFPIKVVELLVSISKLIRAQLACLFKSSNCAIAVLRLPAQGNP